MVHSKADILGTVRYIQKLQKNRPLLTLPKVILNGMFFILKNKEYFLKNLKIQSIFFMTIASQWNILSGITQPFN